MGGEALAVTRRLCPENAESGSHLPLSGDLGLVQRLPVGRSWNGYLMG